MKIYIDTANITQIKGALELGYVAGVTTNPTLISQEIGEEKEILKQICQIIDGPVSAEVIATDSRGMIEEARDLAKIANNIVIKIPMTKEGLKAVKVLSNEAIRTNVTLVFSANQGLLAARAGAAYVSPFIGRLDQIGHNGMDVVGELAEIFDMFGIDCEIIAASIRHPRHVTEAALAGADIATVPFKVLDDMIGHPMTDIGLEKFIEDWKKSQR
jgi:transaldolase